MNRLRWTVAAIGAWIALASGCGSGHTETSPTSPTRPAAPVETRFVPFGFGGPLFQPDVPLRLEPGVRLSVPVMTDFGDFGNADEVLIRVLTDAPPALLTVSEHVAVKGRAAPGLVEIHVPERATPSAATETFQIWLAEHPEQRWAPGWGPTLDERRLLVAVAGGSPPPSPCERLELTDRVAPGVRDGGDRARLTFGSVADNFHSVTITLRSDHPETSLTLLSRYRMPYADLDPESDRARVRYHLYPTTFAFGFGFRETRGGFQQTMSLGWFDEFHLRAEAPGCDPMNLSCDETGRCSPGSPTP